MQTARRFPGMAFRVETPTTVDLPRMDVAAFVGFAQRGPVQVPVVLESYPDFVNIFGGLYRLAWDGEAGLWQTACLAPAVKAFFAQGGRRCWVVRVASAATTTGFSLGGLLQTLPLGEFSGVEALARCPGSWADHLQTRVDPLFTPLEFLPGEVQPGAVLTLSVQTQGNVPLQAGEVLQIDVGDRRHRAYGVIPAFPPSAQRGTVTFTLAQVHWFHRLLPSQLPLTGTVQIVAPTGFTSTFGSLTRPSSATGVSSIEAPIVRATFTLTVLFAFWWRWYRKIQNDQPLEAEVLNLWFISLAYHLISSTLTVLPGDWLRLETESLSVWLLVETVARARELSVQVWAAGPAPSVVPQPLSRVQQVRLALQVRSAEAFQDDQIFTLANLAGAAPHPRFVGNLPDDAELFAPTWGAPPTQARSSVSALWQTLKAPRFPLSLKLDATTMVIPLGLDTPLPWRSGQVPAGNALERDGLVPPTQDAVALTGKDWAAFLPTLFLDPALRITGQRSLLNESSDRLYLQGQSLIGIHSLIPLEEVSLVALPDAAHLGWRLTPVVTVTPESSEDERKLSDLCAQSGPFMPCVPPPETDSLPPPLPPTPTEQWQFLSTLNYDETGLLEVQQAIARMVAALGDRVAVLGLPKHYRLPEVLYYQQQLLSQVRRDGETTDSYLAFYHPWLITRDDSGNLIHTEPTGANAGVMAALSLTQGAWIAPANERLQDTLATVPIFALGDEQTLYSTGINPIRKTPSGFVAWGSYTQSLDPEFADLNVRRLLILLRRLALQEGQTYVFAPHSAAFRRRVQQQFEQMLARLFERGAFAGRVPTDAYQVVIDASLNSQTTVERGQLIVELRVAPAQPLTFITVRLVQQETNQLTVQEVQSLGS
ncbi:MAG: hypothetical protein ACKO5P_05025 [Nodosilinea sp.]